MASVTSLHSACEAMDSFDIYCSEGSIHIPSLNEGIIFEKKGDETISGHYPAHENVHYPLIADFVNALNSGKNPLVTAEKALQQLWF